MAMSPWVASPKYTEHEIFGGDHDILHYRGKKSATCTVTGYCQRTQANIAILNSLTDGSTITITHDVEGTRSGVCTSCVPTAMDGGIFCTFTMTVVEQ